MFHYRSERGQVLVLILLALAGIMGFAALVVDGGHLYSERRRSQSAADAAAMAAASAGSKGKTEAEIAAIVSSQASENGFFNGQNDVVVSYNHPPVSGPYAGNSEYYQISIKHQISPIFSQFVFAGSQAVTVESISRVIPPRPLTGDNAMMALATCACGPAIVLDGNVNMTIRGGRIFSNEGADRTANGNGVGDIRVFTSSDPADATQGDIATVGTWDGINHVYANFITVNGPVALDKVPLPYCPANNETINGVKYWVWRDGAAIPDFIEPGIHCVHGTLDRTGNHKDLRGADVLVVLLDGGIKAAGNSYIDLTRASDMVDANGNQWGGMVVYAPESNHSTWEVNGNSTTLFNGTLYAPRSTCDLGGTPDNQNIRSAFICWQFKIEGSPHINITYVPEENWQLPTSLSLVQ